MNSPSELASGHFLKPGERDGTHSSPETAKLQRRIATLESQLQDCTELLHLWMNEACSYHSLAKAVATGSYPAARALKTLAVGMSAMQSLQCQAEGGERRSPKTSENRPATP